MPRSAIICPYCGAIESPESKACHRCGNPLIVIEKGPPKSEVLAPLGSVTRGLRFVYIGFFLATLAYAIFLGGSIIEAFLPGRYYFEALMRFGMLDVVQVLKGGEWYRIFTATLLHFGAIHLFFNTMALGAVGPEVEKNLGAGKFLFLYVTAGILSNLFSLFWHVWMPGAGSHEVRFQQAGASGAICGLIGALYMIGSLRGGGYGQIVRRVVRQWVLMIVVFGFIFPGIDNAAHLSGIVAGLVLARIVGLKKRAEWTG